MVPGAPVSPSERAVLGALEAHGASTRAELQRATGLSRSALSSIVSRLENRGLLRTLNPDPRQTGRGRPAHRFELADRVGSVLALDHSQGILRVDLVGPEGDVLRRAASTYDWLAPPPELRSSAGGLDLLPALTRLRDEVLGPGDTPPPVVAAVLGAWGPFRPGHGWATPGATHGPPLLRHDPTSQIQRSWGLPVHAERGVITRAVGEAHRGAGRSSSAMLFVQVVETLALGVVIDGQPVRGAQGLAGEVTHVQVDESGPRCFCGRRGCLGATTGFGYIVDRLRLHSRAAGNATVIRLAEAGDRRVLRELFELGARLGKLVSDLVLTLDIDVVVVDGQLGPVAAAPVQEALALALEERVRPSGHRADVLVGELSDRSHAVGSVVLSRMVRPMGVAQVGLAT